MATIVSSHQALFKGLAIKKKLDEKRLTSRPVITLGLSSAHPGLGVARLSEELRNEE
ncbi:MAG: hypothetical protein LBR11_11585 [Deltaproteobacteria bacterium]|nr:hypothetical protein [Deltaproteobacteria bacterium]